MDTGYYSPSRRAYYNNSSRGASPEEIRSSLRSVQRDYVKALEEIAELKNEKANLKAVLNQSFNDKAEEDYREYNASVENATQRLKQSYTQKALIESEQRVVELEDENIKLRRLLDNNSTRLKKLQNEIVSYQDQVDKLDHLQVFNKHLQAEMQYLDQELNTITKRVEDLDDEKTKAKIKKSVSVKYSQDYNQTIIKYVNHILGTINHLEQGDPIRVRFEELFPISSNMLKLVANRDYANLMLKSFKLIADLLPKDLDQDPISPTFSHVSMGAFSAASPHHSHNASNGILRINGLDVSRNSSHATNGSKIINTNSSAKKPATPTSKARPPSGTGLPLGSAEKGKIVRQDSISSSNGKKPREQQLSVSFGVKDFKPRLLRSTTPNVMRPSDSTNSLKANQSAAQRGEPERMGSGMVERRESEKRNSSFSSKKEELHEQVTAELEYIQRERELIEKERELMEKQRELIGKAKELEEKEQALQEHQELQQEERLISEADTDHSRGQSYKKVQGAGSYAALRRMRQEEREHNRSRSPSGLRPILKSSSSQVIATDHEGSRKSLNGTPVNKSGAVKDFSNVLREKSKHLAKVLNGGIAYDDEIQMVNTRNEEGTRGNMKSKSRERTPMGSNMGFEYEGGFEQLRASKIASTSSKKSAPQEEYDNTSSDDSNKREYYAGSGGSTFKSNSKIASYHPTPVESKRREDREVTKKVSFNGDEDSMGEDDYVTAQQLQQQQYRAFSNMRAREQDDEYSLSVSNKSGTRTGRAAEPPKGTQYASFSVSFGRTESAERSASPSGRDAGSILDAPMKKRVDHLVQTYDVITGDDVTKIAIHDNWSPHYKVTVQAKSNGVKKTQQRTQTPNPTVSKSSIRKNKV